jgi:hypothetical protein
VWRPINRIVYFLQYRLPCAIELFKDALGVCSPAVGFGIEIVMIEKAEDVGEQGPRRRHCVSCLCWRERQCNFFTQRPTALLKGSLIRQKEWCVSKRELARFFPEGEWRWGFIQCKGWWKEDSRGTAGCVVASDSDHESGRVRLITSSGATSCV